MDFDVVVVVAIVVVVERDDEADDEEDEALPFPLPPDLSSMTKLASTRLISSTSSSSSSITSRSSMKVFSRLASELGNEFMSRSL